MLTLCLVRHGEVENPEGIIYGRLPGFGLSRRGRGQIDAAADKLAARAPFDALYASPMQRAQESAEPLASRLGLPVRTEERIIETDIGSFQGKRFEDLPKPYITEEKTHPELEAASSMRRRLLSFAEGLFESHPGGRVVAVSHRDPIIVALLHWQGRPLDDLPGFDLDTGAAYEVVLLAPDRAQKTTPL